MSLVAYCASDDSDASDTAETEQAVANPACENESGKNSVPDQISDDEDYQAVSSSSSALCSNFRLNEASESTSLTGSPSVIELPPPQKKEEGVSVEETDLEEEVKQKPSELADAPKPPPKRTKQPVKITIPSLNDIPDDDADDNEDDGRSARKKKPAISSVKSGLFSLLPAPLHSSKKEINRPLIPHSVTKKQPPSKPVVQAKSVSSSCQSSSSDLSNKRNSIHSALTGYDSNSDDDEDAESTSTSQNFFSLASSSKESHPVSSSTDNGESTESNVIAKTSENAKEASDLDAIKTPPAEEIVVRPEPGLTNDAPLDFGSASRFSSWSGASSGFLGGLRPAQVPNASYSSDPQISSTGQSSVQYNMVDNDVDQEYEALGTEGAPSDDLMQVINDKEFQRIQGKRKRGMEEAINFVDAKVDDYVDPSELSKHITEESEYSSSSSKKNKEGMPTNQQRRKKQITFLAFQAKEKEMELKNTWSQNRLTKRQTQAKYGF